MNTSRSHSSRLVSMIGHADNGLLNIMQDVLGEIWSADCKFGRGITRPDGTGLGDDDSNAIIARSVCDDLMRSLPLGDVPWRVVMWEEVLESFAETDPDKLRAELLQVAATAIRWAAAIDARTIKPPA